MIFVAKLWKKIFAKQWHLTPPLHTTNKKKKPCFDPKLSYEDMELWFFSNPKISTLQPLFEDVSAAT